MNNGQVIGTTICVDSNDNGQLDTGEQSIETSLGIFILGNSGAQIVNTSSDIIIGPPFYSPRLVFEADGTYRIRRIAPFGSRIVGPTSFSVTVSGGETNTVDFGATAPEVTVTAVGAGAGAEPTVVVSDDSGKTLASFFAFERSFRGGVQVALGDVDGDGQPDLVAAAGASGGPHVRVFSGRALLGGEAKIIREFFGVRCLLLRRCQCGRQRRQWRWLC